MSVEMRRGFWRMRCGRIAEVVGRRTGDCNYPWIGVSDGLNMSWSDDGSFMPGGGGGFDLAEYLGETLRRLPDSPGWWWYESGKETLPVRVVEEHGKLHIAFGGGPVSASIGRWGDKIEPSGFEEAAQ